MPPPMPTHHSHRMKKSTATTAVTNAFIILLSLATVIVISHGGIFAVAADLNLPTAKDDNIEQNEFRKEAFLNWFVENGGIFHAIELRNEDGVVTEFNVTIEQFPSFGGWGLALPILQPLQPPAASVDLGSEECQSHQTTTDNTTTAIIKRLDPLFTVPSSLIISVDSILDIYTIESSPFYLSSFYPNVNKILIRSYPNPHHGVGLSRGSRNAMMGLVEQDVVIAMQLMVEECHHHLFNTHQFPNVKEDSHWGKYLDVLPQYIVPRLDTFGDEEYEALHDANLEYVGRNSKRLLERLFSIHRDEGGDTMKEKSDEISLQSVIRDMIHRKIDTMTLPESSTASTPLVDSCISFDTFHRFVTVVASRAMVLNGRKYLTPLADMINYSPYVDPHNSQESRDLIKAPFTLFHSRLENNSITVRSDRDVFLPPFFDQEVVASAGRAATLQLFEDYGPVDNSLFLEAHGFVPYENPNNCAIISGANFLRRYAAEGRFDENVSLVLRAFKVLQFIHPDETKLEALNDVCVKANLEIVDDGEVVGRKPASDALAITYLVLGDSGYPDWIQIEKEYGQSFNSLRDKCIAAIHSKDAQRVEIRCARYPGSSSIVKQTLRSAARRVISGLESKGDTEADLRIQLQLAESQGRHQLAVAIRFRLEEQNILRRIIAAVDECSISPLKRDEHTIIDHAEKKLFAFKSFVKSLNLPINKIEPVLVGNGLRLGAFATDDIDVGESYISFPSDSVIDIDTALASVDKFSDLAALLHKYSKQEGSRHDGDFDVLLLYILHERFVLKERSRWWAYLDLLPTIDDMRELHPLFFDHEEIDRYLSGSGIRQSIVRYQRQSSERHKALSSNLATNLVLGYDTILDRNKVYWAIAILDSRSIWWNGKRHLVPLLDLVNADDIGRAHETRLEDFDGTEEKVAVTRASRYVKNGNQIFENYAQPNHMLFTYHGFILEDNQNDCALLDGLHIHRDDLGAEYAHRGPITAATFCIRDNDSMDELAQFLRFKYDITLKSDSVDDSVRPYLVQVLEERIARLTEGLDDIVDLKSVPRLQFMRQIVKNDLVHFRNALGMVTLK